MSKIKLSSKTKTPFLYLVSKSPRRYDLLKKAGYQFEALSIEISEIIDENLNAKEQCAALARFKMSQFLDFFDKSALKDSLVLTCDTMVEFEGRVLGKPESKNQAKDWILSYSEKRQKVHTGCQLVWLKEPKIQKTWTTTTEIFFSKVNEEALETYFEKHPDFITKAGGYGIQDEHFKFIEKIEGSYTNVVGLPLEELQKEMNLLLAVVREES